MLDNTITLSVDTLNNGTPTNRVYSRFDEYQNRTVYKGPAHSFTSRDTLGFYRTPIKPDGTSNGVAKSAVKLTQDIEIPGKDSSITLVKPMIGDFAVSIPVGATVAQTLEFRQRMIAVIDHAISSRLVDELEI